MMSHLHHITIATLHQHQHTEKGERDRMSVVELIFKSVTNRNWWIAWILCRIYVSVHDLMPLIKCHMAFKMLYFKGEVINVIASLRNNEATIPLPLCLP